MRLSVLANGVRLGERLRDHIDRRLHFAVGRFRNAIDYVVVRLEDTNGPRGGVDKQCRIVVKLHGYGGRRVAAESHDENIYAAVAHAASRAGRTVGRTVHRSRDKWSSRRHRSAANPLRHEQEIEQEGR